MDSRKLSKLATTALAVLLIIGGIFLVAGIDGKKATVISAHDPNALPPHVPAEYRYRTPDVAVGVEAIRPVISNPLPNQPAFSRFDVELYINRSIALTGGAGLVHGIDPSVPVTITSIEFLVAQDVNSRLHGSKVGQPDNTLLCLVELAGRFSSPGAPGIAGLQGCSKAFVVYHATTGNKLMHVIDCGN
jgi:hypothetical protein